jgi:2,4-dienoyl-CoA reductase-like NADH-dependent reductase (Old Yellow Enzyme family)
MAHLFTSKKVGAYASRVVRAPMTRLCSIQPGDFPSPMMADYYGQRASEGGLEIKGVSISIPARSYLGAARFYYDGQMERWRATANAVHAKGGRAFMQLIHGGRQSHVEVTGGVDLISVWGAERVGARISPSGQWGGISDSNPEATFSYVAKVLDGYKLAYLHVIEPRMMRTETLDEGQAPVASSFLRKVFGAPIIAAGGFDREGAEQILQRGDADLVAFARWFSSNPDLPERSPSDVRGAF